jgi:hypothetical protein
MFEFLLIKRQVISKIKREFRFIPTTAHTICAQEMELDGIGMLAAFSHWILTGKSIFYIFKKSVSTFLLEQCRWGGEG